MEYLRQQDARLAAVIDQIELPALPPPLTPYGSLLRSVLGQHISRPVAKRLWQRLLSEFGDRGPERLIGKTEQLRALGLSSKKVSYLQAIAQFAQQNDLSHQALACLSDQQVIQQLTVIPGVGIWTVQMLLIFSLQRPDILALEDLVIRRAMQQLYGVDQRLDRANRAQLQKIAAVWAPHRSTACRYLWEWQEQAAANQLSQ